MTAVGEKPHIKLSVFRILRKEPAEMRPYDAKESSQRPAPVPYAHTPNRNGEWHRLDAHSRRVGNLAATFARDFGASRLARLSGLLHDIGKMDAEFQAHLKSCMEAARPGGPPMKYPISHSIHGARYAAEKGIPILPMILDGHHTGLSDLSVLKSKLSTADNPRDERRSVCESQLRIPQDEIHRATVPDWASDTLSFEFLIRMLFSALVDANLTDAEAHFSPGHGHIRPRAANFKEFWELFRSQFGDLSPEIQNDVLLSAERPQGVYRLISPPGEIRTRITLAFPIRHALECGLRRVIFAVPGDGSTGDVAESLRRTLGERNVMEEYRSFDPPAAVGENASETETRRRFGTQNWAATFIVTTHAQLLESLFSNKPSRCRKLHNIARSVIVIDEIGSVPSELLTPAMDLLKELTAHYGVTLLLTSSSNRAFSSGSPVLRAFFPAPSPITPDLPSAVVPRLETASETWSWQETADEILRHPQVLCIADNRRDALALFDSLDDSDAFHLSAMMCPAHRREAVSEIRDRLSSGRSCRVVSTAVMGAVDILAFPVILRTAGTLHGLSECIDRCASGRVVIFTPSKEADRRKSKEAMPLIAAETRADYRIVVGKNPDPKGINLLRRRLSFSTVADAFRFTEEPTEAVIVRDGDVGLTEMLDRIQRNGYAERHDWQNLQRYSVMLTRSQFRECSRKGLIQEIIGGINVWVGAYGELTGMPSVLDDPTDICR
jgi:CRISPR-associated endonuclease/helicase Cas3